MIKNLSLTFIFVFLWLCIAFAQFGNQKSIPPNPIAASLGSYGQIPVSLFNGTPQISIPLGEVAVESVNLPISLSYRAGGVRPDQHAGWTGVGFDLIAAGVITRKVNGGVDEIANTELVTNPPLLDLFSYYKQFSLLDKEDWFSDESLFKYRPLSIFAPNPSPDEFMFNFAGYTGSFFYDHKGKWQVKSESPLKLVITEELVENFLHPASNNYLIRSANTFRTRRSFYKFKIVTPDGAQYFFGGSPETVEFTAGGYDFANGPFFNPNFNSTAWYLNRIITKNGREINLRYESDGFISDIQQSNVVSTIYVRGNLLGGGGTSQDLNVNTTSYLAEITAPGKKIKFYRSESKELKAPGPLDAYLSGEKRSLINLLNLVKWFKLDSVVFSSNDNVLSKFSFSYIENVDSRLFLKSLQQIGQGGVAIPAYEFNYSNYRLPAYLSGQLDHWGFYNGSSTGTDKNPKSPEMQAGTLISIKYPTGGITELEYEPHYYGSIVKRNVPHYIVDSVSNSMAGGLRIRKIIHTSNAGTPLIKEYFYVNGYNKGGRQSSGVSAGIPVYADFGTTPQGYDYTYSASFPILPLSYTNGNHVTYSEVTEKESEGGYTIYNYANHDQEKYRDRPPLSGHYSVPGRWTMDPDISMALDRGKILEKKTYNSLGILLKQIKYDYDESAEREQEAVRVIYPYQRAFDVPMDNGSMAPAYRDFRVTAGLIYTFPRLLTNQTETDYDANGGNPITTIKKYAYNRAYRQQTYSTSVGSDGKEVKNILTYPYDIVSQGRDNNGLYQRMVNENIISAVIEEEKRVAGVKQSRIINNYSSDWLDNIILPSSVQTQFKEDTLETRVVYKKYGGKGNLLSVSPANGAPTAYVWSYQDQYPIAEVRNAETGRIAYGNFEELITGDEDYNNTNLLFNYQSLSNDARTGKKSLRFVDGNRGSTLTKLPAGRYRIDYWSKGGTINLEETLVKEDYFDEAPNNRGWSRHGVIVTLTSSDYLYIYPDQSGTTILIDDLRIYPVDAQMTTYTYDPTIGITSQTDPKGQTIYYEYDALQRLKLVKDQMGNIIKSYSYYFK